MQDGNVDQLNIGIVGDASSLDKAFGGALTLLDRFTAKIDRAGDRIEENLTDTFRVIGQFAVTLDRQLTPLTQGLFALTAATERLADTNSKVGGEGERAASALSRLRLEYQAGLKSAEQYRQGLEKLAKEAKEGSQEQLVALRELRKENDRVAGEAEEAARRQADAAKKAAQEVENAAKRAAAAAEAAVNRAWAAADKIGGLLQKGGQFLTRAVSLPMAAAGAYTVKVTIDYDKAYTDVRKFTEGTKEQLDQLKTDLRKLSLDKVVGTSFEDLSSIAAFGSQLGIERQNLKSFVTEVAYLGKAGDIAGEQGATGLAKLSAAMKVPQTEFGKMASSLAEMGEAGASSLSQILDTSKRFASEAKLAHLKPSDVFAYANAVTTLGQEAEAGGSALIKTFDKIESAVNKGGKGLEQYANVAGMSAKQFAEAYRKDAAGAVQAFLAGLDRQAAVAGRMDKILEALGIKEVREKMAVRNLAGAHEFLADALDKSAKAYEAGDVHKNKAAIAATALSAQLAQLQTEIKDAAYEAGQDLVPALIDLLRSGKPAVDLVRDAARAFHALTPEQQEAWIKFGLIAMAMGPLVTGIGSLVGWVVQLRGVFATIQLAKAAADIAGVGTAATTASTGIGALVTRGVAAFAMGSVLAVAIIGFTALVAAMAKAWWDVHEAESQAAESARRYTNMKEEQSGRGKHSALAVRLTEIAQRRSDVQTQIDTIDADIQGKSGRYVANQLKKREALVNQLAGIDAEYATTKKRMEATPKDKKEGATGTPAPTPKPTPTPTPTTPEHVDFNPALFDEESKSKKAARFLAYVPLTGLEELVGKDLGNLPTNAATYDRKRGDLDLVLAQARAKKQADGTLDEYAFDKSGLAQKMLLADNAIRNTGSEMDRLRPKIAADEKAMKEANAALNAQVSLIRAKGAAGKKATDQEWREHARLMEIFQDTRRKHEADKKLFAENEKVNKSARQQKTQDLNEMTQLEEQHLSERRQKFLADLQERLKAHKITRAQYEAELSGAMDRVGQASPDYGGFRDALSESETTRGNAGRDLRKKTLLLDHKDFEALREELTEELAALREAGVEETAIAEYEAKKRQDIDRKEFDFHQQKAEEAHRADYESGVESIDQYRAFLVQSLGEVQRVYGQTSAEAAKLNLEINKLDFAQVAQRAGELKDAYDAGTLSLQQYIVALRALQATLPQVSGEYKRLEKEIDSANRRMIQDARRAGDEIGSKLGDAIVGSIRKTKSIGQAIHEMLNDVVDAAIKDFIKRQVSKLVFKVVLESNADKMKQATQQQAASTNQFASSIDTMGKIVDKFAQSVRQMANAGNTGGSGSTSTGNWAFDAAANAGKWMDVGKNGGSWWQQAGNAASIVSGEKGSGSAGDVSKAVDIAKKVATNKQLFGGAFAGKAGALFAKAAPYVSAAMAAYSLLDSTGVLKSKYLGFQNKEGLGIYSQIGKGDHTGLIDSGYSGVEALRNLQSQHSAATTAAASRSTTNQFAAGAIVVNAAPGQSAHEIAQTVWQMINDRAGLDDSLHGTS